MNRYKAWLNNLSLDESLNRWTKIKNFFEFINTTNRETILKGLEKTKLNREFDLDECIKDKVPSVVLHGAKTQLGWNETNKIDVTSGDEPIHTPLITFYKTETES